VKNFKRSSSLSFCAPSGIAGGVDIPLVTPLIALQIPAPLIANSLTKLKTEQVNYSAGILPKVGYID
jgi:hypothetical protein